MTRSLEELFKEFERLRSELDKVLTEAEVYQHNGMSGYDAICRAQALSQKLNRLRPLLVAKIEEARKKL